MINPCPAEPAYAESMRFKKKNQDTKNDWNFCTLNNGAITIQLLSCWTLCIPLHAFAKSVVPDQLASEEANWSGSALFAIQYVNLYQQCGSNKLIGVSLKVGVASEFIQHDKG